MIHDVKIQLKGPHRWLMLWQKSTWFWQVMKLLDQGMIAPVQFWSYTLSREMWNGWRTYWQILAKLNSWWGIRAPKASRLQMNVKFDRKNDASFDTKLFQFASTLQVLLSRKHLQRMFLAAILRSLGVCKVCTMHKSMWPQLRRWMRKKGRVLGCTSWMLT